VEQALLVSPILDMKRFIELMPQREDDYYEWVVNNPITSWAAPTYILRPEVDLIVSEEVGHDFISQHQCQVTIMPDGEHWFHTPEQLAFLKAWEEKTINIDARSCNSRLALPFVTNHCCLSQIFGCLSNYAFLCSVKS
jgi:hypothetical protein